MNRDIAQGQWKQLKGKVREFWGRLTDDEVNQLDGRFDNLAGKVQEKYGLAKDEAAEQVNDFLDRYEQKRDRQASDEQPQH